ncbi:venom allergen 5.02-like [Colias croceus]|uniref:venom allergen 5.02-like n=1 Tax=Colias crocea TaxID=72248 RepID=UPI001E27AB9C|nr:venom allergen 5.02-like [Colias croceus]
MDSRVVFISLLFFSCIAYVQPASSLPCRKIRTIVNGHNQRRLQLAEGRVHKQPAASEMKYMIWDEELAAKASKWASRNKFEHNPDRTIGSNRFTTGENIYWQGSTDKNLKFNPENALNSWFNEHKDYTYGPLTSEQMQSKKMVGHYTQMVWSDSVYIGCGLSSEQKDGWIYYYFVCNYGPSGNYLGEKPYPSGTPSGHLTCSIDDCKLPSGDKCY